VQTTSLTQSGYRLKPKDNKRRSTAYYIFDPEATHIFEIDHAHFVALNKRFNVPIVTTGVAGDMERIAAEMVSTSGTIWKMVELFVDGATLSIPDTATAAVIYRRILDHFDHHFTLMKTDKMYHAPPAEDFRAMGEFATAIRPWALQSNPEIEQVQGHKMQKFLPIRATFSQATVAMVKKEDVIPKSVKLMDNIERYLEMQNGG